MTVDLVLVILKNVVMYRTRHYLGSAMDTHQCPNKEHKWTLLADLYFFAVTFCCHWRVDGGGFCSCTPLSIIPLYNDGRSEGIMPFSRRRTDLCNIQRKTVQPSASLPAIRAGWMHRGNPAVPADHILTCGRRSAKSFAKVPGHLFACAENSVRKPPPCRAADRLHII